MPFLAATGLTPRLPDGKAYYAIQFGWCTEHEKPIKECKCAKPPAPKPEQK